MEFEFLSQTPIDIPHTLEQLGGRLQTIRDGLPELIKNSKDQYSHLGISDQDLRQIVVLVNTEDKGLAVLDFAGATSQDLVAWQKWSNRKKNRPQQATDIEASHGNGGKFFMVRGSSSESFIESCYNGQRNKMGYKNNDSLHEYRPAYIKEGDNIIRDLRESQPEKRLKAALQIFGIGIGHLPQSCHELFSQRKAFTMVQLNDVREWEGRTVKKIKEAAEAIPASLESHGQAALTIASCRVWVIADGKLLTRKALELPTLTPFRGFESAIELVVPPTLSDPRDGVQVSTGDGTKLLILKTSERQLRQSEETKAFNIIRVKNQRNVVGYWTLADLAPVAASAFLYGELTLPAFTSEHTVGAEWEKFADTPLVRAVKAWVAERVDELAQRLQKKMEKEVKPEERSKANEALSRYRDLMRNFLETTAAGSLGIDGYGNGKEGSKPRAPKPPTRWGTKVDNIVLEPTNKHIAIALGTKIPLDFKCYENVEKDQLPVRKARVALIPTKKGIVKYDNIDHSITGVSPGRITVKLQDLDTGVESNELDIEVVICHGVDLIGPDEPILQGERVEILYSFRTPEGIREDLFVEAIVDDVSVARITRKGFLTACYHEGTAAVHVRFGPGPLDYKALSITVGRDAAAIHGSGGSDIPMILLCGTEAPGVDHYPKDQRTHHGGDHFPTIIEEPQFTNIVWLNLSSKEAQKAGRHKGGPSGVGGIATASSLQFLALKCFEILKRLVVRNRLGEQTATEREFTRQLGQAETDCSNFVDGAYEIANLL